MGYPRRHPYKIEPEDGRLGMMPPFGGVRFLVGGDETGDHLAILEHPLEPKGASMRHTHSREDEYTFILEGRIGFEIGGEEFTADPGTLVLKPRGIPHAFWNTTDAPARVLELVVPGGLEHFFEEMMAQRAGGGPPDPAAIAPVQERYGITFAPESSHELAERHGLQMITPPAPASAGDTRDR
jgi:quercetin dioxygenase-like cupin family protein